ncbi:hypothetical protein K438DRAFT_1960519 [Mycena galopus ATCC 62051]|nr:hypothetical protein K438DRAFT_1960519 [Mycena galopus ATCC 62051]
MTETITNILLKCTGITSLYIDRDWESDTDLLPVLEKMRPRKLNLAVPYDSQWAKSTLNQPLFLSVTHLELFKESLDTESSKWEDWSELAALPALTHLCFSEELSGGLLRSALTECPRLVLVVTAFWNSGFLATSRAWRFEQQLTVIDSRVVVMVVPDYDKDWETGARGGDDFWARAETFLARKRQGEIESTCYFIDERNNPET